MNSKTTISKLECGNYNENISLSHVIDIADALKIDFSVLLEHDRKNFSKPEGWQHRATTESPLVRDLHTCWGQLQNAYLKGLPEIAYREIPSVSDVEESITQILSCIKE